MHKAGREWIVRNTPLLDASKPNKAGLAEHKEWLKAHPITGSYSFSFSLNYPIDFVWYVLLDANTWPYWQPGGMVTPISNPPKINMLGVGDRIIGPKSATIIDFEFNSYEDTHRRIHFSGSQEFMFTLLSISDFQTKVTLDRIFRVEPFKPKWYHKIVGHSMMDLPSHEELAKNSSKDFMYHCNEATKRIREISNNEDVKRWLSDLREGNELIVEEASPTRS